MCLVSQHQVVSQKSVPCGDVDAQMLGEGLFGRISLYHSSDQLLKVPVKGEVRILPDGNPPIILKVFIWEGLIAIKLMTYLEELLVSFQ